MTSPLYTPAENPPFNMARYAIGRAAAATPQKPALLVFDDPASRALSEVWTYAELEDAVLRLAGALRAAGLAEGDRVMIRLENTSAYAILFFAAIAAGCVALPASSQLTDREAAFLLADSGAAAIATLSGSLLEGAPQTPIIFDPDTINRLMREGPRMDYAATDAESPAFLIYTSGTTADPKGVLHAQRAAIGRVPMYQGWYGITSDDRVLHAGAFNWTFTLGVGLTDPWANGATAIVYTGEKSPELWPELIRRAEATLFAGVPGLFRQILKYADVSRGQIPTLRHALMAGEAPPPGLFEEWTATTGTPLYEALGMSEISTYISTAPGVPRKAGTVGKPQAGRRVAILGAEGGTEPLPPNAEGLIAVHLSDPGLMLGYWNRPGEQAEVVRGEWFVGGDLGIMDEDGYIIHTGRNNDIMKALGYRVSPLEVEAVLAGHPDIAEVACTELEVRTGIHVVGAFVVPKGNAEPEAEAILRFAAERLAAYKCPREIRFLDALPRTANGKVRRASLVALSTAAPRGLAQRPQKG
jgi:acyl-coenzyme A synthetase/AMP-(fatty) acid ligase